MKIDCDWHMHSRHSPCGRQGTPLALLAEQARASGLSAFGISDHLHCRLSLPALRACRAEYDALEDKRGFHFGLEVSCLRRSDLERNDARGAEGSIYGLQSDGPEGPLTVFLPEGLIEELNVEYVIGGAHWLLGAAKERDAAIRSYHRQNMFLASHPAVDIVAHPWWWMGAWKAPDRNFYPDLPWLGDFTVIPRSMHDEFAAAARENSKAVEINLHAILLNPQYPASFRGQYVEYLAGLKEQGVTFSIGSDSHGPGYEAALDRVQRDLEGLDLTEADLWKPGAGKKKWP